MAATPSPELRDSVGNTNNSGSSPDRALTDLEKLFSLRFRRFWVGRCKLASDSLRFPSQRAENLPFGLPVPNVEGS